MSEMTKELEKKEDTMPASVEKARPRRTFIPRVDIYSNGDEIVLLVELPGVDERDIDVTLEKDLLTIRGQVTDFDLEGYQPIYSEYRVGQYERSFKLSEAVDRDNIEAVFANGVLRLELPKSEAAKARKIMVQAEA